MAEPSGKAERNIILPHVISTKRGLPLPNVISTKRGFPLPNVISTKRSAWRDLSTTLGMTMGGGGALEMTNGGEGRNKQNYEHTFYLFEGRGENDAARPH